MNEEEEEEVVYKYTYKFDDGSYLRNGGDCSRNHKCGYLKDATLYDDVASLKFWAADNSGTPVKIKVTYQEIV